MPSVNCSVLLILGFVVIINSTVLSVDNTESTPTHTILIPQVVHTGFTYHRNWRPAGCVFCNFQVEEMN